MMKKIAILAFTVSAALTNAFAADECTVYITGSTLFTGNQIKPTVTRVDCGDDEFTEFENVAYGPNIDVGEGSVTVTLPGDKVAEKTFTIRPKSIYIKPDDCEKERGNPDPEFTWNMTEVKNLNADSLSNLESVLKSTIKLKRQEGEEIVNSKYEIVFADGIAEKLETLFPNYKIGQAPEKAYLTITKTHITISAKDVSKIYGAKDPELEYVITGNIETNEYGKLGTIKVSRDTNVANLSENVGKYKLVVSGDSIHKKENADFIETADFIIDTIPGTMTITPAPVSVTVDDTSKVYGDKTPEFKPKFTGLVGKDQLEDVSVKCKKCKGSLDSVGTYDITIEVTAASNPNYSVTTSGGTLTVTPKAVAVTMNNAEKTYGDEDPKFTYEAEGLVTGGDALKAETITRAEGEKIGTYKVSVAFDEKENPNYKLTTKSSLLTINPKAVTLSVDDVSKKFGDPDPELTYKVDGLASFNGKEDTLAGVKLVREKGEDAGEYAITATVNAKSNPNYDVTIAEGGSFKILANDGEIIVTVKGHVDTVRYDGKKHTVKGFDISSNSTAYSLKFVKFTGDSTVLDSNAGTYGMGLSDADFENTSVNYPNVVFEVTDGSLTITPKPLVITALSDSITYGDATPAEFKWVADSLLKGDSLDNIHVGLAKTGLLPAGEYVLDFDKKSPTNTNYVVTDYVPAVLKVGKKVVTVTVGDTSKVYGTPDPEFTVVVDGLVSGDKLAEYTVGREPGEDVLRDSLGQDSAYRISVAFASEEGDPNYILKVRQGDFTITPYTEKISVSIIGDEVCRDSIAKGESVTVARSFDVLALYYGENALPDSLFYKKEYVYYKGDSTLTGKNIYGKGGLYPMNFVATDFVNISPNFTNVELKVARDGNLILKETCDDSRTRLVVVKAAPKFSLSAVGRSIHVSGSTVGKRFAVYDMQGKVIRTGSVESSNFEVPVAGAGIYMVRVGSVTQRVRVK